MKVQKVSWKLMKFHGILLWFCWIMMYFVNFCFRIWCFWKLTAKFWSHSDWFEISKFLSWWWQKVEKVNHFRSFLTTGVAAAQSWSTSATAWRRRHSSSRRRRPSTAAPTPATRRRKTPRKWSCTSPQVTFCTSIKRSSFLWQKIRFETLWVT